MAFPVQVVLWYLCIDSWNCPQAKFPCVLTCWYPSPVKTSCAPSFFDTEQQSVLSVEAPVVIATHTDRDRLCFDPLPHYPVRNVILNFISCKELKNRDKYTENKSCGHYFLLFGNVIHFFCSLSCCRSKCETVHNVLNKNIHADTFKYAPLDMFFQYECFTYDQGSYINSEVFFIYMDSYSYNSTDITANRWAEVIIAPSTNKPFSFNIRRLRWEKAKALLPATESALCKLHCMKGGARLCSLSNTGWSAFKAHTDCMIKHFLSSFCLYTEINGCW